MCNGQIRQLTREFCALLFFAWTQGMKTRGLRSFLGNENSYWRLNTVGPDSVVILPLRKFG